MATHIPGAAHLFDFRLLTADDRLWTVDDRLYNVDGRREESLVGVAGQFSITRRRRWSVFSEPPR